MKVQRWFWDVPLSCFVYEAVGWAGNILVGMIFGKRNFTTPQATCLKHQTIKKSTAVWEFEMDFAHETGNWIETWTLNMRVVNKNRICFDPTIPAGCVAHTSPRSLSSQLAEWHKQNPHTVPWLLTQVMGIPLANSLKSWNPMANSFPMTTMILNGSHIGGKCELWKRFLPFDIQHCNLDSWGCFGYHNGIISSRVWQKTTFQKWFDIFRWMRLRKRTSWVTFAIHLLRLLLGGGFNTHMFFLNVAPKSNLGEEDSNWKILQNLREAAVFSRMGWLKRNETKPSNHPPKRPVKTSRIWWQVLELLIPSRLVGWLVRKRWAERCMKGMVWLVLGTQHVGT